MFILSISDIRDTAGAVSPEAVTLMVHSVYGTFVLLRPFRREEAKVVFEEQAEEPGLAPWPIFDRERSPIPPK